MTVADLITDLQKVEDKNKEVIIHSGIRFDRIRKVSLKTFAVQEDNPNIEGIEFVFLHRGELK